MQSPLLVMLFGRGLIGGAALDYLLKKPGATAQRMPWDWLGGSAGEEAAIARAVRLGLGGHKKVHIATVWAAGKSGFGSDEAVMEAEFAALQRVIKLARGLSDGLGGTIERSFHIMSSAGGLFEGQRACIRETPPDPLRAYGRGKLAQECAVAEDESLGQRVIYRPSSVYGYEPNGRMNLISALVLAAFMKKSIRITGALQTQRDYVTARDVGRFIADRLVSPCSGQVQRHLLASGRPASIFEIVHLIERRFGSRMLIEVDPDPVNSRHITFSLNAMPPDFAVTPLGEGIERVALLIAKHRFAGRHAV